MKIGLNIVLTTHLSCVTSQKSDHLAVLLLYTVHLCRSKVENFRTPSKPIWL